MLPEMIISDNAEGGAKRHPNDDLSHGAKNKKARTDSIDSSFGKVVMLAFGSLAVLWVLFPGLMNAFFVRLLLQLLF